MPERQCCNLQTQLSSINAVAYKILLNVNSSGIVPCATVMRSVLLTRWCSWLRHCGTNQKVAGSIPDGVIGIFH